MTPEEAFLQAICEQPDDDTPRLAYADWLEERGDSASRARAEFIRVQFALRDLPPYDPLRIQLEERERALRMGHEADWLKPLQERCRLERCQFRRGFVERGIVRIGDFLEDADTLFQRVPVQEIAFFSGSSDARSLDRKRMKLLASSPHLQRLRGLDLSEFWISRYQENLHHLFASTYLNRLNFLAINLGYLADCMATLLEAPFLSGLTNLKVIGFPRGEESIEPLLRSPRFTSLETLDLCHVGLSVNEFLAIGDARNLDRLKVLHLTGNQIGVWGDPGLLSGHGLPALISLDLSDNELKLWHFRLLSKSSLLGQLESLSLSMNRLDHEGLTALAATSRVSNLRHLNLSTTRLESESLAALANSPHFERLTTLLLRTNRLGDAGMQALCGAAGLPNLHALQLSYNGIGPAGVRALVSSPPGRLAMLDLSWNPLTDDAVHALARSEASASLGALDLSYAQLGDDTARALAESAGFPNLHTLNLSTNHIGDAGLRALAHSPGLPRLTALNLGYNAITDAGLRTLAESPLLERLAALNLAGNRLDPKRVSELRRDFRGHLGG